MNNSLDEFGLRQKVLERQAMSRWGEIVGKQVASSSIPENVREGVMFVACKSSMWANELTLLKTSIIKKYSKSFGRMVIKDIRFSARGFKRAYELAHKDDPQSEPIDFKKIDIREEDKELASKVASISSSKELAEKIEKAVLAGKKLSELKRREGWKTCPKCSALHNSSHDICNNCR